MCITSGVPIEHNHKFVSEELFCRKDPMLEIGRKSYLFITQENKPCLCSLHD